MSELKIPPTNNPEAALEQNAYDNSMRFLNIRPYGYRTNDALRIDVVCDNPSVKHALIFNTSQVVIRNIHGERTTGVAWKFNGIQSFDLRNDDPLTLSYFADADYDIELLQKELADELDEIHALRQQSEKLISTRPAWHDKHMKQLGKIATALPTNRTPIPIEEWRTISSRHGDKPQPIKPYTPPGPERGHYGIVRPVGYQTEDALKLQINFARPGFKRLFLRQILDAPATTIQDGSGNPRPMACWHIGGIQSVDAANSSHEQQLSLFIDSRIDHDQLCQQIQQVLRRLPWLAKE